MKSQYQLQYTNTGQVHEKLQLKAWLLISILSISSPADPTLYFTAGDGFLSSLRKIWCKLGNVDFLGRTVSSTRSVEKPLHTCKGCVVLLLTHGMQMPLYPATRSVRIAIIACLDESGGSWYDSFIPLLRINIHKLSRRLISHLWMNSTSTTTPIMLVEQPRIHVLSYQEVEPPLRHIPWVQWLNSESALR